EELKELEYKLNKEFDDVEKLKKLSLSNIISTIMKNKDEKMEKEEKEYLMAKLEYDQCESKIKSLKVNINTTTSRLEDLSECENEYSNLLNRKIALFNIYGDEYNKNELINMEAEIDSYLKEIKELDESISVGNSLVSEIENTKKLLESAKAWGTLDLFGGDFISSLAKHQKVDEAQRHFSRTSNLLDRFNKELRDININGLRFSTTSKTFDIFFDNIFTDIAVNNQINKSYNDICSLQRNVETVLKNIKENKRQLLNIVNIKRKEYEEFINNL
ncbi:MAG: hypothetical protein E7E21_06685, partial [Peptostreptococcaceae bacterium]|nr:hypothetical protein [Peptostreptococcaceae bacterium]